MDGAIRGTMDMNGYLLGALKPWNFMTFHILGISSHLTHFFQRGRSTTWVNYNDLTVLPNPGIMVNKGNYPNIVLFQVSEIL